MTSMQLLNVCKATQLFERNQQCRYFIAAMRSRRGVALPAYQKGQPPWLEGAPLRTIRRLAGVCTCYRHGITIITNQCPISRTQSGSRRIERQRFPQ